MSTNILLRNNSFRFLYYRYKDSPYYSVSITALAFAVCIVLLFQVVIPQVQNWFSISDEARATQLKISALQKNINFMNNIDKAVLNNQFDVATRALPPQKDFDTVLIALSDAGLKAGVSFDDFNFQVGNIATEAAKPNRTAQIELPYIKLIVTLSGSMSSINEFMREINSKLPLSETMIVEGDARSTAVTLQFYQKPFPKIAYKDDQPIPSLSDANIALVRKLSTWQPESGGNSVSSASAVPLF